VATGNKCRGAPSFDFAQDGELVEPCGSRKTGGDKPLPYKNLALTWLMHSKRTVLTGVRTLPPLPYPLLGKWREIRSARL